jgi:hypothetical protein
MREDLGPVTQNPRTKAVQRPRPNAVGLIGVIFKVVATAAPITATAGHVRIAVGFGSGI